MKKEFFLFMGIFVFLLFAVEGVSAQTVQYSNLTFDVSVNYSRQDITFTSQTTPKVIVTDYQMVNFSGNYVGKFNKKVNEVYFGGYLVPYTSMYIAQFVPTANSYVSNTTFLSSVGKEIAVFNLHNTTVGVMIEQGDKFAHLFELSPGGVFGGYNYTNYFGEVSLDEGLGVFVTNKLIYEISHDSSLQIVSLQQYVRDDLTSSSNPWTLQQFFL